MTNSETPNYLAEAIINTMKCLISLQKQFIEQNKRIEKLEDLLYERNRNNTQG